MTGRMRQADPAERRERPPQHEATLEQPG
jgi:hypothetical protein